jgi:hypothetical protein
VTYLVALIAIPLSIELIGRLLAIRDGWEVRPLRPAAFQRLVAPLAVIAIVLWIFPPSAWRGLVYGAVFVIAWRWLALITLRVAMRLPALRARSIDLD